ncbi:hypothetical protein PLICRDRAFT_117693 [Plicaturopsis crispa FD-325 SS-3]|uniref:Uncharacterized protein n=1 Tax=Plicaturopsis crispa FD-325 SS-3 TaxID=944288 RepID=A0A0C9T8R7_PLICR|nr:hypothetical protein PLICRDRAFT_117693 [Plicaturopsis crispa FD-325 SS-3]
MLIFLLVMVTLEVSIMAVLIGITISRIAGLPVISTKTGCSYSGLLPVSSLFWVPALIFEPVLCFLVLARTWKDLPRGIIFGRAPNLPAVLARDSILYFILVFINLLAATIIFANFPHFINVINPCVCPLLSWEAEWASAIPSLLGSRLLLNMRERMLQTEVMTNKELGLPSGTEDSVATLVAGSNPRHSHYRNQSRSYGVSTDIGSVEMKSFVEMQSPDARYDYTPRR